MAITVTAGSVLAAAADSGTVATTTSKPTAVNWQSWGYYNYAEALQKSIIALILR